MDDKVELFKGLRVKMEQGDILINLEDVARGLGFTTVATSGNETIRWKRVEKYLNSWGIYIDIDSNTMIPESAFYLLAMKASNKTAVEFQKKVAKEIIPNYRKSKNKTMTASERLLVQAQINIENEKKLLEHDSRIEMLEAKTTTRLESFTVAGYATLLNIKMPLKLASSLGRKASSLCKKSGIVPDEIPDPRFGRVKSYPSSILEEIFSSSIV